MTGRANGEREGCRPPGHRAGTGCRFRFKRLCFRLSWGRLSWGLAWGLAAALAAPGCGLLPAAAQEAPAGAQTGASPAAEASGPVEVRFAALLTAEGPLIEEGLTWRVFRPKDANEGKAKLVATQHGKSPTFKLPPGEYMVNVAYGRAHITRKITVRPGEAAAEPFILNAGGLRLEATVNGGEAAAPVTYDIYADERDQGDSQKLVLPGAKPKTIYRLNAGLYQIVSRYGDANATVRADVTVEAGKLTEVVASHLAATITFKLVAREGGEALPDTQWLIQTAGGETVKESIGALPTHVLAPGTYIVTAKSGGRSFSGSFTIEGGEAGHVELVMK